MHRKRKSSQLGLFEGEARSPPGRARAAKHAGKRRTRKRTGHGAAARAHPVKRAASKKRVRVAGYCVKGYTRKRPKAKRTVKKRVVRRARRARRVKKRR